jgi:hypothetical protein
MAIEKRAAVRRPVGPGVAEIFIPSNRGRLKTPTPRER